MRPALPGAGVLRLSCGRGAAKAFGRARRALSQGLRHWGRLASGGGLQALALGAPLPLQPPAVARGRGWRPETVMPDKDLKDFIKPDSLMKHDEALRGLPRPTKAS